MLLLYIAALSAVSFCAFGWDKFCAVRNLRRIPEKTLLTPAALGGTPALMPGCLLPAQTQKQPFGFYLAAIAVIQGVLIAGLVAATGGAALAFLAI